MEKIKISSKDVKERRELLVFFKDVQMSKLMENIHKGTWKEKSIEFLLERLKQEVVELEHSIEVGSHRNTIKECGDIGNFAAFIADRFRK